MLKREKLFYLVVALAACSALIAYLVRPKAPSLDLVSAESITPVLRSAEQPSLSDRIVRNYDIAFVLMQSPYTHENALSLEALRMWARSSLQRDPDFLHPLSFEQGGRKTDTVFGAAGHSLLGTPYYMLQGAVGALVRDRIADFQQTAAYEVLSDAYFELFGVDPDASLLLARYQSDRARQSVDIIIWCVVWLGCLAVSAVSIARAAPGSRLSRLRLCVAGGWVLLGLSYMTAALAANEVGALLSSVLALSIGVYFARPFIPRLTPDGRLSLSALSVNPVWWAVFAWISYTVVAMQVLSWVRTPLISSADPVTLLFSAFSGNFLHDPAAGKHAVKHAVALVWLALGAWVLYVRWYGTEIHQLDRDLAALEGPYPSGEYVLSGRTSAGD